jgi:NMD protein affecting ribosome stability and mRNA decay
MVSEEIPDREDPKGVEGVHETPAKVDEEREEPMSAGFCVMCGATDVKLFGAMCAKCVGKKGGLIKVPERIEVIICPFCGSRQTGRHWERGPPPGLFRSADIDSHIKVVPPAVFKSVQWEESRPGTGVPAGPSVTAFNGRAVIEVGDTTIEVGLKTELKVIHHTCPMCSRREGRYYTANIQFRPSLDDPFRRSIADFKKVTQNMLEEFLGGVSREWREAIAWEEEIKEGLDLYLMDTAVAKAMARNLRQRTGATSKESASLWGIRDGKKTYRVTILLRFPTIMPGDFFERDGKLFQVLRQEGENYRIANIEGDLAVTISKDALVSGSRFVGGLERFVQVMVDKSKPLHAVHPLSFKGQAPDESSAGTEIPVVLDKDSAWWVPVLPMKRRWRQH